MLKHKAGTLRMARLILHVMFLITYFKKNISRFKNTSFFRCPPCNNKHTIQNESVKSPIYITPAPESTDWVNLARPYDRVLTLALKSITPSLISIHITLAPENIHNIPLVHKMRELEMPADIPGILSRLEGDKKNTYAWPKLKWINFHIISRKHHMLGDHPNKIQNTK